MALEPVLLDIIADIAGAVPKRKVLCLGYPDILSRETFGLPEAEDAEPIKRWHGWKHRIIDANAWFEALTLQPEYWDITKARGPEKVVDLNQLMTWPLEPEFGLLIDPGTLEHVWNAPNVLAFLSKFCPLNGYMLHSTPAGMGNHGFWSIHPTAFADFYEANGFKIELLLGLSGPTDKRAVRDLPLYNRFNMNLNEVVVCLARRDRVVPIATPHQTKYRLNPMLKAGAA